MSREIKFRAWHEPTETMYEVHAIVLHKSVVMLAGINGDVPFSDIELMQFTGLKDKNGVEIYEGDIIKGGWDSEDGATVEFNDGGFSPFSVALGIDGERPSWVEVIGNHHEPPHLLPK